LMPTAFRSSSRLPDQAREQVSGSTLTAWADMRVHGHGDHCGGVAESLGYDVHRLAGREQDRGVRVTQVVQPDRRHGAAPGDVPGELPGHLLGVAQPALEVAEYQRVVAGELQRQ